MLNVTSLKTSLLQMFDATRSDFVGWPPTLAQAVDNFASAYDLYALAATDASGDSVATTSVANFKTPLLILAPGSSAADAAQAFDDAFVAYWTGGVFAVGTPPTPAAPCPSIGGNMLWSVEISSIVQLATPNILKGLLLPEFAVLSADPDAKATAIANAFHTATTTAVMVLITGLDTTPPPAGPLPITNICTIF
jgi:hypothetical protein